MPAPPVGTQFTPVGPDPIDFEAEGTIVARYLRELGPYTVTLRNADFVAQLVAEGRVVLSGRIRGRRPAGIAQTGEG
ncbi:hypothetical protein CH340_08820 [Rhodoplanes serenus]|nr:hypothetical protein CH340_08820 [Rhodoplanes serenus]